MTHTPGPWGLRRSKSRISINCASGQGPSVAMVRVHESAADCIRAVHEANATLIAAAPAMKEALEDIRDITANEIDAQSAADKACAIAKAALALAEKGNE